MIFVLRLASAVNRGLLVCVAMKELLGKGGTQAINKMKLMMMMMMMEEKKKREAILMTTTKGRLKIVNLEVENTLNGPFR